MTRAVFLDRDGVLNKACLRDGEPHPPGSIEEMVIFSDAPAALNLLHRHGFRLIVVTNQPDIARRRLTRELVHAMNEHLCRELPLDGIEICEHDDADGCACRKPEPGMLLRAARRDGIDLPASFMVGDRWRDVEAGRRAGCRTVLIGNGYSEPFLSKPDASVRNLTEAVDWILKQPINAQDQS